MRISSLNFKDYYVEEAYLEEVNLCIRICFILLIKKKIKTV